MPTAYGANPPCMRKSKAQTPPQVSPAKHSWLEGAPQGFAAVMGSGKPCKASKMLRHGWRNQTSFQMCTNIQQIQESSLSLTHQGRPGRISTHFSSIPIVTIVRDCVEPQGTIFFCCSFSALHAFFSAMKCG